MDAVFFLRLGRFIKYFGGLGAIALFLYGLYTLLLHNSMQGLGLILISLISGWSVSLITGGCYLAAQSYRHQELID